MFTSEKTDINFKLHNCDRFASLYATYKGIDSSLDSNLMNKDLEKHFLKMAFSLLKNSNGKLLFVVAIGKSNKEVDRLVPSDRHEAVAFANLMAQIEAEQRQSCRNCNPQFKKCVVVETLKLYKKKLVASNNA